MAEKANLHIRQLKELHEQFLALGYELNLIHMLAKSNSTAWSERLKGTSYQADKSKQEEAYNEHFWPWKIVMMVGGLGATYPHMLTYGAHQVVLDGTQWYGQFFVKDSLEEGPTIVATSKFQRLSEISLVTCTLQTGLLHQRDELRGHHGEMEKWLAIVYAIVPSTSFQSAEEDWTIDCRFLGGNIFLASAQAVAMLVEMAENGTMRRWYEDTILRPCTRFNCALGSQGVRLDDPIDQAALEELLKWSSECLKGKQRRVVELVVSGKGSCPLSELAVANEWDEPVDVPFNSIRTALNEKLRKIGWRIERHDNQARLVNLKQK